MKKYLLNGCVLVALLALTGCVTPIGVEKVSARQAYQHLHQNALNSSRCSAETMKVLHRYNLDDAFDKNPDATLEKLQTIACTDDRRDLLYALSELNYLNADHQCRSVKPGVPQSGAQQLFHLGNLCLPLSVW